MRNGFAKMEPLICSTMISPLTPSAGSIAIASIRIRGESDGLVTATNGRDTIGGCKTRRDGDSSKPTAGGARVRVCYTYYIALYRSFGGG